MFVDQATIEVEAGRGGDGAVSFRREKYVPRGGPDGGEGGRGGDVLLTVDPQLSTLLDYQYAQHYRAEHGRHGMGKNKTGASGADVLLRVPPGTVVHDAESGDVLVDMMRPGQRWVAAHGGRGGRGNAAFATSTNRAPRNAESGEPGERRRLRLELKLIADVGLLGQPNAGKSTLLSVITAAHPKIADYPFTTLEPGLGVVSLGEGRGYVVADLPGILEGAHEGRGLGLQFLRHIERTRALAYLVPVDAQDPSADYAMLRAELSAHSEALAAKPHCVVRTKADLLPAGTDAGAIDAPESWGTYVVSAVTGQGLPELREAWWRQLQALGADGDVEADEAGADH